MGCTSVSIRSASASSADSRSYLPCRFIHIWAEVPKKRARRRAVSAERERRPLMISVSRLAGTRKASASAFAVIPASSKTVFNTWPGWIGGNFLALVRIGTFILYRVRLSVIIRYFDTMSIAVAPIEADAELIVDSNAVLSSAISHEFFQAQTGKRQIS